jgi:dihydrofolate reductase
MRRIIVSEVVTVDGYFAGPNGEIDWFVVDGEFNEYSIDMLNNADLLIFGRVTYDLMAGYWSSEHAKATDPIVAGKMNTLSKVVFSKTLENVDWQPTRVLTNINSEEIMAWKQQPGKDMLLLGSGSIVQAFTSLVLIDEYRLIVDPVILGSGKPLLKDVAKRNLKLEKLKQFTSGNVLLYYSSPKL